MSKAAELREKTVQELEQELFELHKEQFNLRMQMAAGRMAEHSQVKKTRRSIARVKTLLKEKSGQAS